MTFKLAQFCSHGTSNWITQTDNATVWHSRSAFLFNKLRPKLPELVMVHDHPEPPGIRRYFLAISDGHSDVDSSLFGINWERYQWADFSAPVGFSDIVIVSRMMVKRSVFEGIFDNSSLVMCFLTVLALLILLWVCQKRLCFSFSDCSAMPHLIFTGA